jgi:hypothetical protein
VQCEGVERVRDIEDNSNILQQQPFAITTSERKLFRLYLNNMKNFYHNKATVLQQSNSPYNSFRHISLL